MFSYETPVKLWEFQAPVWTAVPGSNNTNRPATAVSSSEGTNQNQDHVSFSQRVASCKRASASLHSEGGVKKRWLIEEGGSQCVGFSVCACVRESRVNGGLASKR